MWRSLFYSFGIGLFVLGLQALITDHVVVPKNTKIQKLIKKVLSDDKAASAGGVAIQAQGPAPGTFANPNLQVQAPNQSAFNYNTGSRFGPSRFGPSQFSGPAYGTGYGGSRITTQQNGSAAFGGFRPQGTNAQIAGFQTSPSGEIAPQSPVAMQKIYVREWMPWSLLASGAITFLYTHTLHRRRFQD